MPLDPEDIRHIIDSTEVVRAPKQMLATFGSTVLTYFVVTEPAYTGLPGTAGQADEAVVRTGKVTAARPQIVTPAYLLNLFHGFEHGQDFARYLTARFGPYAAGLMYRYEQEPGDMEMVSDPPATVARRIAGELDRTNQGLAAVILGSDQFWDVSLAHFIHGLTAGSVVGNAAELNTRGLLQQDGRGVPRATRERIEGMFQSVASGQLDAGDLRDELRRWNVFSEYEDRFLALFRRR